MLLPLGILASASGGADYELITTTVLGSSQPSVTFSSFAGYKHLQLRIAARATTASNYVETSLRFNSDSTSVYATHELDGAGSGSAVSFNAINQSYAGIGYVSGSSATTYNFGAMVVDLLDYLDTNKFKTLRGLSGVQSSSSLVSLKSGLWRSTSAVTTMEIFPNGGASFIAGSRFSLYGLKG